MILLGRNYSVLQSSKIKKWLINILYICSIKYKLDWIVNDKPIEKLIFFLKFHWRYQSMIKMPMKWNKRDAAATQLLVAKKTLLERFFIRVAAQIYRAGSPFSQDLQMRHPHSPAPHHPCRVKGSQKPTSNTRTKGPERLRDGAQEVTVAP